MLDAPSNNAVETLALKDRSLRERLPSPQIHYKRFSDTDAEHSAAEPSSQGVDRQAIRRNQRKVRRPAFVSHEPEPDEAQLLTTSFDSNVST